MCEQDMIAAYEEYTEMIEDGLDAWNNMINNGGDIDIEV
jgi:hypothetical protein